MEVSPTYPMSAIPLWFGLSRVDPADKFIDRLVTEGGGWPPGDVCRVAGMDTLVALNSLSQLSISGGGADIRKG